MKKILITLLFSLYCFGIVQAQFDIPSKPEKQTSFYDYIGLLNKSGARFLEEKLIKYSDSTSTQIVIIIINSTKGENILDLATKWGNEWGIGHKEKDNGIVLLMAKEDRKVAIATGEGIRDKLKDSDAKFIIDTRIVSQFRKGQYYRGLNDGIVGVVEALNGKMKEKKKEKENGIISDAGSTLEDKIFRNLPTILLAVFGLLIFLFGSKFRLISYDDDRWDRMDRYDRRGRHEDYDSWDHDHDSGGSSDGGFGGGFGGGSFGGGGASGSW